jgi:hypothetical protein
LGIFFIIASDDRVFGLCPKSSDIFLLPKKLKAWTVNVKWTLLQLTFFERWQLVKMMFHCLFTV